MVWIHREMIRVNSDIIAVKWIWIVRF